MKALELIWEMERQDVTESAASERAGGGSASTGHQGDGNFTSACVWLQSVKFAAGGNLQPELGAASPTLPLLGDFPPSFSRALAKFASARRYTRRASW